jgi:hypothetical protein
MKFLKSLSAIILLMELCIFTGPALAQSAANTGEIVGVVLDQSGASIAGAAVTVRNKGTNFSRITTTDTAGRFAASYLPLGPYQVSIAASGFEAPAQQVFVTLGSSVSANRVR